MKHTIACLQMTTTSDMNANVAMVEAMIREAAAKKPVLIATPENTYFMRSSDADAIPEFTMEKHPGICERAGAGKGICDSYPHRFGHG